MKKLSIFLLLLLPGFLNLSCKRSFLESVSRDGTLNDETAFKTKAGYESFILGAYSEMQGGAFNWIIFPGFVSQDLVPVNEIPKELNSYMTAGSGDFAGYWGAFYKIVGKSNLIIERIAAADESVLTAADKAILEAEAKFIRGFAYFNLARAFGNIPMPLGVYTDEQKSLECTPEAQVWDQVILDLTTAAANLPKRSGWDAASLGRTTKGAALAYLANAYLYKKEWANANKAAEDLFALGEYKLLDNVRTVFSKLNENTEESIFEVQFRDTEDGGVLWTGQPEHGSIHAEYTSPRNIGDKWAPFGGWGELIMNKKLADSYEPTDDRRTKLLVTIGDTYQGELMTEPVTIPSTITQNKSAFSTKYWHGPETKLFTGQNIVQMRFAEVLLNYSESLFESGNTTGAYTQLNKIRTRAGLADKPATTDREQFLTDLMNERRWELNFEPNLWFHYTRTDRAGAFLQSEHNITFKTAWNKFPIPQIDRDLNPKLCQNEGY